VTTLCIACVAKPRPRSKPSGLRYCLAFNHATYFTRRPLLFQLTPQPKVLNWHYLSRFGLYGFLCCMSDRRELRLAEAWLRAEHPHHKNLKQPCLEHRAVSRFVTVACSEYPRRVPTPGGRPEDRPPLPGVRGGVAFRDAAPDLETALHPVGSVLRPDAEVQPGRRPQSTAIDCNRHRLTVSRWLPDAGAGRGARNAQLRTSSSGAAISPHGTSWYCSTQFAPSETNCPGPVQFGHLSLRCSGPREYRRRHCAVR